MLRTPLVLVLLAALSTGCVYDSHCTPTTTVARDAAKVNLSATGSSSVLEATVRAGGTPVTDVTVTFAVRDHGSTVYDTDATTGSSGTARADLKRIDPAALVALARADSFRATFAGNGTYCGSGGGAAFHAVRG